MSDIKLAIIIALSIALFISLVSIVIILIRRHRQLNDLNSVVVQLQEVVNNLPTIPIDKRVETTTKLFELIDTLIEYEIVNNRRYEIFLEKKNGNLDVDNAITEISTAVYEYIKPEVYNDKNNIVTQKCLFGYIQKRVFIEYFRYLQQNNVE